MLRALSVAAACLSAALVALAPLAAAQGQDAAFRRFVEALWPEAQQAGVSRATFDRAFQGVAPDLSLPDLVIPGRPPPGAKGQAEFVKPPQAYLDKAQLARLAEQGKAFMARHLDALTLIERKIGVERGILMGIWGRESAFGTHKLPHYAIRALATQAWLGRRKDFFRAELIAGLRMLEDGIVTVETMRSSWAGALGMPQFLPRDYYAHAYDLDGDGRKDIWTSIPDALASIAKQLMDKGWRTGVPWAYEVVLPARVDCANEGPDGARTIGEWEKLGVARAGGKPFSPRHRPQPAYLMSPGGTHGPVFLATENFKVIRLYNTSDLYAVFVGHLGDRILGGGDFVTPWRGIGQLPTVEIEEAQQRLQRLGYPIEKIDGKIGSNTRRQIGMFQRSAGMAVDCWPSAAALERMRGMAPAR